MSEVVAAGANGEAVATATARRPDAGVRGGEPILRIEGLRTQFSTAEGLVRAVDGVDLEVAKGQTMCVVGESGCGKSVTARSILQLVEPPGRITDGSVHWRSEASGWVDVAALDPRSEELRRIRGADIGMVFQESMASLSPMYTVGAQLVEAIQLHQDLRTEEAFEKAIEQLTRVGIPQPKRRMDSYPFELSGGMCQRVMIAIALSCDPALLIADEPTTALDVTTQARILDLLKDLQAETGMALVFITHDLGVVAEIADDVTVMYLGTVVERGSVAEIFEEPQHPYTQALLRSIPTMRSGAARRRLEAIRGMVPHPQNRPTGCPFHTRCEHAIAGACDEQEPPAVMFAAEHLARCHLYADPGTSPIEKPAIESRLEPEPRHVAEPTVRVQPRAETTGLAPQSATAPLIEVDGLVRHFPLRHGFFSGTRGVVRAVDGVDLAIRPGETLGLVGESGCGKTTLGRCLARVDEPTQGRINYRTVEGTTVDLASLRTRELRRFRSEIRVIFQDPFSSLNPRMTLEQLVGEPLRTNRLASGSELRDRVAQMLSLVGLRPEYMPRYPHAFSGGERQRINIARALVTGPRFVIADEAVSALDVSVRAQILNLLSDLQEQLDLTYLFISHDLSVIEHICDRVTVMYLGKVAENADTDALYRAPQHPYTEALLHAVPLPDPQVRRARHAHELSDELPDPTEAISGCPFHTRCPHARAARCADELPELRDVTSQHLVACHYADELTLRGITQQVDR